MNSPVHEGDGYAVAFGDLAPRTTLRILQNKPTIDALRLGIGPCAVRRVVPRINVDSFNAQIVAIPISKRPSSKNIKRTPFGAYRNTPSAVVFGARDVWVAASSPHGLPYPINPRSSAAMSKHGASCGLSVKAPA